MMPDREVVEKIMEMGENGNAIVFEEDVDQAMRLLEVHMAEKAVKKITAEIPDRQMLQHAVMELFKIAGFNRPSVVIAFLPGPEYRTAHWITNVTRKEGIKVMRETAAAMEAQLS